MLIENDVRADSLLSWTQQFFQCSHLEPIAGDASSRRYFRIYQSNQSIIAVDAPPATENSEAFVNIAALFAKKGLVVPEILAVDYQAGFLLITDLGNTQLLNILNPENAQAYYCQAFNELIKLQKNYDDAMILPHFNLKLLTEELYRFNDWYLDKHLNLVLTDKEKQMLASIYDKLIASALEQPQVCVHRDYHSRNLMVLNNAIGILDFQDAVIGPITYDLVSLLRDCYIKWPGEWVDDWLQEFWQILMPNQGINAVTFSRFKQWFDWMGLQRHLKVLGIFARLFLRDNKANYLKDVPRILEYILSVTDRYKHLAPLKEFLITRVMPHESNDISCRSGN